MITTRWLVILGIIRSSTTARASLNRQPGGLVVFPGGRGTQPKNLAFLRLHGSGFTTTRAEQATTDYQTHQTDH
jgi:hypothetical protein